ncbi:hypothetical protein JCM14469_01670 [Desulfatiferula olefinivorans]
MAITQTGNPNAAGCVFERRPALGGRAPVRVLTFQPQLFEQGSVTVDVFSFEIVEQPAPTPDEDQKTAA